MDGDRIAAAIKAVAYRQSLRPGAWQRWRCLEVEGCKGFVGRELRLGQVARVARGQFVFYQNREDTGGGQTLGVGTGGNLGPKPVEAGQA